MQNDVQIASRFRPMELPRWQDDDSLGRFLRSYEKLLPLRNSSHLGERAMLLPLLERSGGVTFVVDIVPLRLPWLQRRQNASIAFIRRLPSVVT